MPYKTIHDLPNSVQHVLPSHAQEIYLATYNSAHSDYFRIKDRRHPDDTLEEICHRVAWSAVKKKYKKGKDGRWVEKDT
ncbi:MAG: ChaB family protein [Alphaproteobacteria bacterium]